MNGPAGDERRPSSGVLAHLQADYVETALYFTRIGTMFSCLAFLFSPFFTQIPSSLDLWYRRALLASAASWALRLHQRVKVANTGFSQATWQALVTEDAFHYLFYSILFAFFNPVSVSLMPIFLYALMHTARFTQKLLEASIDRRNAATGDGPEANIPVAPPTFFRRTLQTFATKVEANTDAILRWIALNEIMLFFVCIFMAITGSRVIFLPFIYYHFLKMRYCSRRNPYSRMTFSELRLILQSLASHNRTPQFVSRVIYGLINLVCRLCPVTG